MSKYTEPIDHITEAFRKIEQKMEQEKVEARRAEELEKFRIRQAEEEKARKKQEILIYSGLFCFLTVISYVVYLGNEYGVVTKVVDFVKTASLSSEVDCEQSQNWTLKVCVERKQQMIDEKWANMLLHRQGKEKPFNVVRDKK